MKTIAVSLVLLISSIVFAQSNTEPSQTQAVDDCSLTMTGGGQEIWTIKVDESRITTDDASLTTDGTILYGFLAGKQFRTKLDVRQNDINSEQVSLILKDMILDLSRVKSTPPKSTKDPSTDKMTDKDGSFVVTFDGCSPVILDEKPAVRFLMEWETSRKVKKKKDAHGWFGTKKGETIVRNEFSYPKL